uniref:Copia protein n=1 Tax=Tanacetum cinerariifolium TaxID=118510 RepID=A0A699HD56_TANCI|nr:copia protein [Tanacetum cinerariifolium]
MSTNTKFANQSTKRKPILQSLRNTFVVRQPNAFQSERLNFSKTLVPQKVDKTNDLSNLVTSNSIPTTIESKVIENDKVIALGMFRINPFKNSREEKSLPDKPINASFRTNPITVPQPYVVTKKFVNSESNGFFSTGVDIDTKAKRPQPMSNTKNNRVPFALKLGIQSMTSGQISTGLDLPYAPSTITTQKPTKGELDLLFEAMYDDYVGGQPSATSRIVLAAQAPQVLHTPTTTTTMTATAPRPTNSSSQATSFIDADHPSYVYKLKKELHGLKQAPRAWYDELSTFLLQNYFFKGTIDPTLFIRSFDNDIFVVQVYVDDIIFGSTHPRLSQPRSTLRRLKGSFIISEAPLIWVSSIRIILDLNYPDFYMLIMRDVKTSSSVLLLTDYGYHFNRIPIYYDSKSAIAISCNPVQHLRTKHISVRYHFIKEHVEKGTIELYFVKTDYQLADIFTKALPAY